MFFIMCNACSKCMISVINCSEKHTAVKCFKIFFLCHSRMLCLQCFDAVGWAAGRASGL